MTALQCFTPAERERAHELLAVRVAHMMGRKLEEADWSYVYCRAKGIEEGGWSNLNIDVMHENLGVEHKMLCYRSNASLAQAFGTTLMHPAATRSIRVPSLDSDPNEAMADILQQYRELIAARTLKVQQQNQSGRPVDMRTGWLLWQESLRQFLYFEEPMLVPATNTLYAEWVERVSEGSTRKGSKNLWVYEKGTGRKKYSITTSAGAKIQPYFDVPPPNDPNVYLFTVIGEQIIAGQVRVWLTSGTARELQRLVGSLDVDAVSDAVVTTVGQLEANEARLGAFEEAGVAVALREDAYAALTNALPGVSDEHCFVLLLERMRA